MSARMKKTSRKAAPRAERAADRRLVERTLGLIAAHEESSVAGQRAIGEHLLDEYYGGDAALARSKSPVRGKSYALLAERVRESGWSANDLRRAIVIAIVYRDLPAAYRDLIAASLLERLGSIEDAGKRLDLAKRIASSELRGKRADAAIAKAGAPERSGGRPRKPAALKAIEALLRAGERTPVRARELGALDDTTRQDLRDRARALRKQLDALLKILDRK